jgi:predicted transcriptional regulator
MKTATPTVALANSKRKEPKTMEDLMTIDNLKTLAAQRSEANRAYVTALYRAIFGEHYPEVAVTDFKVQIDPTARSITISPDTATTVQAWKDSPKRKTTKATAKPADSEAEERIRHLLSGQHFVDGVSPFTSEAKAIGMRQIASKTNLDLTTAALVLNKLAASGYLVRIKNAANPKYYLAGKGGTATEFEQLQPFVAPKDSGNLKYTKGEREKVVAALHTLLATPDNPKLDDDIRYTAGIPLAIVKPILYDLAAEAIITDSAKGYYLTPKEEHHHA